MGHSPKTGMKANSNVVTIVIVSMLLCGCSSDEGMGESTPGGEPPITSGAAVLNYENASISFPLDAYGMTSEEANIVHAAQQIVWSLCMVDTDTVPQEALNDATKELDSAMSSGNWVFGFWSAKYVSLRGWVPIDPERSLPEGIFNQGGLDKSSQCVGTDEVSKFSEIDRYTLNGDSQTMKLGEWTLYAYTRTQSDSRFLALLQEKQECILAEGYEVNEDSKGGGVKIDPSGSSEQQLTAALVEAQCSDDLSFTQQVADVNAAYEQVIIDEHKSELLKIRSLVESRVTEAKKVLEQYGVM